MKKKIEEIVIEPVVEVVEKSELEVLRELHARMKELGVNSIGDLEVRIARLQ